MNNRSVEVEAAVLGAKQNEADALSDAELMLSADDRAELITARVTESATLYADLYSVNAAAFLAALKASL